MEKFSAQEGIATKALTLFGYHNFLIWWLLENYIKNQGLDKWRAFRDANIIDPIYAEENVVNMLIDLEKGEEKRAVNRFFLEFELYVQAYQELQVLEILKIGYWSAENEYQDYPSARDFIGEHTYPGQQKIIEYLQQGSPMPWITPGVSECRICGFSNRSRDLSDGKYMWPEGLAHYLQEHNLRLPQEFEDHVASDWEAIETTHLSIGTFFINSEWWEQKK